MIAAEDEAGSQGAGSKASSEVAANVRLQRAKQLSMMMCDTINSTLVRWTVDLNFGTNVRHPQLWRDFEPQEDLSLDMAAVATMVKDLGLRPTTDWIKERFNVELEEDDSMIPTGPEGTAGVDNKVDSGKTLDGMPDDERTSDDGDFDSEGDDGGLDDAVNEALGEEPEETTEETDTDGGDSDADIGRTLRRLLRG